MNGEMAAAIMFSVFIISAFCTVAHSNWTEHKERMKELEIELEREKKK
mgnify:CR=1 FL=1